MIKKKSNYLHIFLIFFLFTSYALPLFQVQAKSLIKSLTSDEILAMADLNGELCSSSKNSCSSNNHKICSHNVCTSCKDKAVCHCKKMTPDAKTEYIAITTQDKLTQTFVNTNDIQAEKAHLISYNINLYLPTLDIYKPPKQFS